MSISGRCLCGEVNYEIDATPRVMGVCHCRHCQRQSGSAFSTMAGVPRSEFRFTRGAPTIYRGGRSYSGNGTEIMFCGRCGSPIATGVAEQPELLYLKIGTLSDTSWFRPQFHAWCDHKQDWVVVEEEGAVPWTGQDGS